MESWGYGEFSGMCVVDARHAKTLSKGGELLAAGGGGSFSSVLGTSRGSVAGHLSYYSPEEVLSGHILSSTARCLASPGPIIVAQDTTYFTLSGHKSMEGLEPLQGKVLGVVQHSGLALDSQGCPLGVVYHRVWTRGGYQSLANEGDKWGDCLSTVSSNLGGHEGGVIVVQDREADASTFFAHPRASNVDLVVRVFQERKYEVGGKLLPLSQVLPELEVVGHTTVTVFRDNQEVTITLEVKLSKVSPSPSGGLSHNRHKLEGYSLVVATEVAAVNSKGEDVFKPAAAAQWILLTSLEVTDLESGCRVIRYYALRWRIERFHYVLKSGLGVERLQFDDVATYCSAVALYCIVAWRLLSLTYEARNHPQAPATEHFEPLELQLLAAYQKKPVETVAEAVQAVGKLGGWRSSKKQPMPGVKCLWQGLMKLAAMCDGARLVQGINST